ncbi:hypothetical protein ACLMJK_004484 [Lecanora helva]
MLSKEILSGLILCLLRGSVSAQEEKKHIDPVHHNAVITHGTLMGFAFAFLFPLGAIVIRTASFRGLVWVHAGIQAFSYLVALTGLGLGVYIAVYPRSQIKASNGHPIIGIIVVGALLLQAIGGLLNHYVYKKHGKNVMLSLTHVWWGRIIVTLGIINAGLGLQLSGNTKKGEIAYGVIAGVIWVTWVAVAVWSHLRSRGSVGETGEKAVGNSAAGSDNSPERVKGNGMA